MTAASRLLLAAACLLAFAPAASAQAADGVLDPIDLHSCTSTSRCTGVYVDPNAPCATVWYVDYEEDPTFSNC